jgi:hypothetical protein
MNSVFRSLIMIAAVGFGLIAPLIALEEKPRLVFAKGEVKVSADGVNWQTGKKGTRLAQDWQLKVGKGGAAALLFPDGSEVKVAADSRLMIADLRYSGKSKVVELKLVYGRLLSRVKKLMTKDSRFNITAGSAVCGVRGTEFMVDYRDGKFEVKNVEGSVFVRLQDNIKYLGGAQKLSGDMKKLGKILRLNKQDREEIGEMHRSFRGMPRNMDGAAVKPGVGNQDEQWRLAQLGELFAVIFRLAGMSQTGRDDFA